MGNTTRKEVRRWTELGARPGVWYEVRGHYRSYRRYWSWLSVTIVTPEPRASTKVKSQVREPQPLRQAQIIFFNDTHITQPTLMHLPCEEDPHHLSTLGSASMVRRSVQHSTMDRTPCHPSSHTPVCMHYLDTRPCLHAACHPSLHTPVCMHTSTVRRSIQHSTTDFTCLTAHHLKTFYSHFNLVHTVSHHTF